MWLVRLALRRPYTFVVMAMLFVILGFVTIARMPTDIFPEIDIPVISVIWNYGGLPPAEMEKRAKRWQPWRSVASWYLWRAADLSQIKPLL